MLGWLMVEDIFGPEIQLAQSRVGKTLLSRIIRPPTLASFSTSRTLWPMSASLIDDSIPPMPLPITRTSWSVFGSSSLSICGSKLVVHQCRPANPGEVPDQGEVLAQEVPR